MGVCLQRAVLDDLAVEDRRARVLDGRLQGAEVEADGGEHGRSLSGGEVELLSLAQYLGAFELVLRVEEQFLGLAVHFGWGGAVVGAGDVEDRVVQPVERYVRHREGGGVLRVSGSVASGHVEFAFFDRGDGEGPQGGFGGRLE